MANGALLRVQNVGVRFGGIVALDDVSFDVPSGSIVGLIGPNGAGKTTLFNCLSRLYQCGSGDILFDGSSLLGVPRHRVAVIGIGRTFQNLALFRTMTVLENIMVGRHCRTSSGFFVNSLRLPGVTREEQATLDKARALIRLLELEAVAGARATGVPCRSGANCAPMGRTSSCYPRFLPEPAKLTYQKATLPFWRRER